MGSSEGGARPVLPTALLPCTLDTLSLLDFRLLDFRLLGAAPGAGSEASGSVAPSLRSAGPDVGSLGSLAEADLDPGRDAAAGAVGGLPPGLRRLSLKYTEWHTSPASVDGGGYGDVLA